MSLIISMIPILAISVACGLSSFRDRTGKSFSFAALREDMKRAK